MVCLTNSRRAAGGSLGDFLLSALTLRHPRCAILLGNALTKELMDFLVQTGTLCTDSSAAKGTVSRIGSGRMKHVEANHLWIQEKCANGSLIFNKIPRDENPSDCLTHYWVPASAQKHFRRCSVV